VKNALECRDIANGRAAKFHHSWAGEFGQITYEFNRL
jgi:hypothetical protein